MFSSDHFSFPMAILPNCHSRSQRLAHQVWAEVTMTATDTSRESDRVECISEGHLQFMRDFIARDEAVCKATLERFLAGKLKSMASVGRDAVRGS
jgi:hypothetical protein